MPRYSVTCTKPVLDYLTATVEVDADTPEQAEDLALTMAGDKDLYEFSHCGDSLEAITCEVTQIALPTPLADASAAHQQPRSAVPYRAICEHYGWRWYDDHATIEAWCGDRWGIAHAPTVDGRERHNDSVYATWVECWQEAIPDHLKWHLPHTP